MKKAKLVALMSMIVFSFAGCGQKAGEESVQNAEVQDVQGETGDSIYGTYDGTDLYPGIPFSVFEKDGWVLDEECNKNDADLDFINKKYPGWILYLNRDSFSGDISDIPVRCYSLYLHDEEQVDPCPPMTRKGLSWGASVEELEEVYGEPGYIDEDDYEYVYYYHTDSVERDEKVEFFMSEEEASFSGLIEMGYQEVVYSDTQE